MSRAPRATGNQRRTGYLRFHGVAWGRARVAATDEYADNGPQRITTHGTVLPAAVRRHEADGSGSGRGRPPLGDDHARASPGGWSGWRKQQSNSGGDAPG